MKKRTVLIALLVMSLVLMSVFTGCGTDTEDENALHCSITVTASDVLENTDLISGDKLAIIPENGIIFEGEAAFKEGANLFDVLTKTLQREKIHYDAQGGSYFVGIGNIYVSDCTYGGWLYKVNGEEPSVGSNEFILSDGDEVEFFYVCDYNAYYGF